MGKVVLAGLYHSCSIWSTALESLLVQIYTNGPTGDLHVCVAVQIALLHLLLRIKMSSLLSNLLY